MGILAVELAEKRLSEMQTRLERLRPQVLDRWRARTLAPDDLERVMELDAEIERTTAHIEELRQRSKD